MMIDLSALPPISAVYRVWHQNQVIYIGQAKNLRKRWKSHHILQKLVYKYGTDWTIDWVEIAPSNLDRAEAFAYRYYQPEFNQKDPSELLGLD